MLIPNYWVKCMINANNDTVDIPVVANSETEAQRSAERTVRQCVKEEVDGYRGCIVISVRAV